MTAPQLVPGDIFAAKYAIRSLYRHLGSSATYHAITTPNREVALKLYDPSTPTEVVASLRRCETITNGLPGNTVMHIVESGLDKKTGVAFSVTDLSVQPSLEQLVELCPLSPSEALALLRNVARTLDLASAKGMFHHALKPTNLFVGPAPQFEVRVADFGANLTRSATRAGDHGSAFLPWMAPEQLAKGPSAGPAADVFSAALVAFFALTGKSYWRCRQTADFDAEALQEEMSTARAPAWVRASELSVQLDPTLDAVFARALATSPGERFSAVGQFADAFEAALGHPMATEPRAPESSDAAASDILPPPVAMQAPAVDAVGADADEPPPRAAARTRWTIPLALGSVLLVGVGGWAAVRLGRSRPPIVSAPTSLDRTNTASPVAAPTPSVAAIEPPTPPASASAGVGPSAPIEEPPRNPESSGLRVAPAHRPVAPAKKPCGKFLKRCN